MAIRRATSADAARMADLAGLKRAQYAEHNQPFHRPAADAREEHEPFLVGLTENESFVVLVSDSGSGIDGFLVGLVGPVPPVYDVGGLNMLIDDFVVEAPEKWPSVGRELLTEARDAARRHGAVQIVVVCGPHDEPKRRLLDEEGLSVVTEWFHAPL